MVLTNCSTILDAPGLRDDYYCTVLAYCPSSQIVAVGLANRVYLWSEEYGVRHPPVDTGSHHSTYVTSISFSSEDGGHSILAVGRNSGQISLWSIFDSENIRFTSQQPNAIACVSFKPVTTKRPSEKFGSLVPTEELLVGDEVGHIYYYSVEWMNQDQIDIHGWTGHMSLLARIEVHTQQICGLAWSPNGEFFATGANDNICYVFETKKILGDPSKPEPPKQSIRRPLQNLWDNMPLSNFFTRNTNPTDHSHPSTSSSNPFNSASGTLRQTTTVLPGHATGPPIVLSSQAKQKWPHSAAVKALAFCPWSSGLIATGGGSNDRAIHFFHIHSGACLATINVHAQVTSLIWSMTRREIAATFGYPQPEHGFRIAVFSWPECRQVVAIPWPEELRALYAVAYRGSISGIRGGRGASGRLGQLGRVKASGLRAGVKGKGPGRGREEGCIVVAGSDECVRFHEIWTGEVRGTGVGVVGGAGKGGLGGSEILEGLQGVEYVGRETIR